SCPRAYLRDSLEPRQLAPLRLWMERAKAGLRRRAPRLRTSPRLSVMPARQAAEGSFETPVASQVNCDTGVSRMGVRVLPSIRSDGPQHRCAFATVPIPGNPLRKIVETMNSARYTWLLDSNPRRQKSSIG